MKIAIMGDVHGYDLSRYDFLIEKISPDILILLHDCDFAHSLVQCEQLSKRFYAQGKTVIGVAGNHDMAHYLKTPIHSGIYDIMNTDFNKLQQTLSENDSAVKYLEKICTINPAKVSFSIQHEDDDINFIVLHGSYSTNVHNSVDQELSEYWARLTTNVDYDETFKQMKQKNHQIMIRGHDHRPWYTYKDKNKGIRHYEPRPHNTEFCLFPNRQHIITAGALCHGQIASINTNSKIPMLKYHWII